MVPNDYQRLRTSDGPAWARSLRIRDLREVDAVVFDCDGVLIDSRKSYDVSIMDVADTIIRMLFQVRLSWRKLGPRLISQLRQTGLFNNDWDTTYAIVMFAALALAEQDYYAIPDQIDWRNQQNIGPSTNGRHVTSSVSRTVESFSRTLSDDGRGWAAVNRYVEENSERSKSTLTKVRELLGYPGFPPACLLATIFDEVYHGRLLYKKMYGVPPRYYSGKGMIENERVLVKPRDLDLLCTIIGQNKLAIATGRPYLGVEHVLGRMMKRFDLEASFFLGDIGVYPEASKYEPFVKPSGKGLVRARDALQSAMMVSVGDSAEDLKMVENARLEDVPVLFAGVYRTTCGPTEKAQFFRERCADLILPTARQLGYVLEKVKNENREK
jgi:phosphoglycolate phosphatase-like HAD superfamily hydrolase